jgi:carboxypeptidase Taq
LTISARLRPRRPEEEAVKKPAKKPPKKLPKKAAAKAGGKAAGRPAARKPAARPARKAAGRPAPRPAANRKVAARPKVLERLRVLDAEIRRLAHVSAVLSWDQETYMPPKAVGERSEQLELLSGLIHDRQSSPELGELLSQAGASDRRPLGPDDAAPVERAYLRELYRAYRRSTRLPRRLVTELAKQAAVGQARWQEARKAADFGQFAPQLDVILGLVRDIASCLGYKEHPYDPLLDEYEPWMKTSELEKVFAGLRPKLRGLVQRISSSGRRPDTSFLKAIYPVDRQREFSLTVLKAIGYDFQRGRLDESAHPFTTTLGRADVRLTTRYNPEFFNTGVFGTIHEAGHGLYELGLGAELADTILADGTSMGIHESQSRMWENLIGRSLPFWVFFYPRLKALFPQTLEAVRLEDFHRAINAVEPSLIRVEADEVTYNLHILVRFELEKRLLTGDLRVGELPEAWKAQYREALGVVPPDDSQGVLQDIHWSMGSFGYFPTYALGNLYAAQFYRTMKRDLPGMEEELVRGEFAPVLSWLRDKVHRLGRLVPAAELCRQVTGESLDPACLAEYLENKYAAIYEL